MLHTLMLVVSCTCGESKYGAVLITESTTVMINDITEETRASFTDNYNLSNNTMIYIAKIHICCTIGLLS